MAGAWLVSAGGGDTISLSAAGFLGRLPPAAPTPAAPGFRSFAGIGGVVTNTSTVNRYLEMADPVTSYMQSLWDRATTTSMTPPGKNPPALWQ